jgi:hypothetical protein
MQSNSLTPERWRVVLPFVTSPLTPTCTATTPFWATNEAPGVQVFVIVMLSGSVWGGQVAVEDCAVAVPPPRPDIVAVTTLEPPLLAVVMVAE